MAEREPEIDEETVPLRSGTGEGEGSPPPIGPETVDVGMEPEPEPLPESPARDGVPAPLVSPIHRAFNNVVHDVMDQQMVVLEDRLGWTDGAITHKGELAAGTHRTEKYSLSAGDSVRWSVGVMAYDILLSARFLLTSSSDQQRVIYNEERLGDAYQAVESSWICGQYKADASGTLEINLDNRYTPLRRHPQFAVLSPTALAPSPVVPR